MNIRFLKKYRPDREKQIEELRFKIADDFTSVQSDINRIIYRAHTIYIDNPFMVDIMLGDIKRSLNNIENELKEFSGE